MCQFCHQHGEGKKWYLKAENYSEQLLSDIERRRYILDFIRSIGNTDITEFEGKFSRAKWAPAWLRQFAYSIEERKYRRDHFGQVVPLEDLKSVFELAGSIVRMPCICRKSTTGRNNAEYCFGLGLDPEKLLGIKEAFLETFKMGPEVPIFDRLTPSEAMELHRESSRKGLIHTLWTFKTPFIGAICNCDRSDCLAMVCYKHGFHLFFRAEYIAHINKESCKGCRACLSLCQFGAIGYSSVGKKAFVDALRCYGCGTCRSGCEFKAIELTPRKDHPIASGIW